MEEQSFALDLLRDYKKQNKRIIGENKLRVLF